MGVAVGLLALTAAAPLALSSLAGGDARGPSRIPPYPLPPMSGTARSGATWEPTRDVDGVTALIYVSETCPFCRRELANWTTLRERTDEVPLWVLASPGSTFPTVDWVPPALRDRVVRDEDGAIARHLGIEAVPATFWVDAQGIVRHQRLGSSSPDRIHEEFAALVGPGGRP